MSGFHQLLSTCIYLALFYLTAISEAVPVLNGRSDLRFHKNEDLGPSHVSGADFLWSSYFYALVGAVVCTSLSIFVCTCCVRKPRDSVRETRGGTQLSNMTSEDRNSGEVTLFPPPSLVLSHEDLNVRFEPLPAGPQKNSLFHTYRPKELEEWLDSGFGLFPRSNIQYLREIGRGWFGQVLEAEIKGLDSLQSVSRCAVKILRPEANTLHQARFVKEVEPLRLLHHPNVLRLLGCCLECPPLLILLQHCPNGDLKLFLHSYQMANCRNPLPENVLLRFACEAAQGLLCWHQAGLVHEDVAARSFMLTSDLTVVLGSYGLSLHTHEEEFVSVGQNSLPVRWIAPELYDPLAREIIHTKASNIWSFGVVLWEIICLGSRPYATLSDEEVVRQVLQEKRTILTAPSGQLRTEQTLYQLMLKCWDIDVSLRPSMEEILSRLTAASVTVSRDLENDFELKWNSARTNQVSQSPTASLNNLHGSFEDLAQGRRVSVASENDDTENGFSAKVSAALRSLDEALAAASDAEDAALPLPKFRLGQTHSQQESAGSSSSGSSLTSSKSWQERMTGGELEALVREKSRSIQDLMVLTHVEPLSDVEFLLRDQDKGKEAKNLLPEIKVTSLSEPDDSGAQNPLLDASPNPQTTPQSQYPRLRLTSTPCSDEEDSRELSPSSPESLGPSSFQQLRLPEHDQEESSVILGPSEDLGLDFYQALTTTQRDRDFAPENEDNQDDDESGKEEVNIQVNIEAWDRFLDEVCDQQQAHSLPLSGSEEVLPGVCMKDSGIARASFNGSDDILGSTFNNSSIDNNAQGLKSPDDQVQRSDGGQADVDGARKLALQLRRDGKEVGVGDQPWGANANNSNERRKLRDEHDQMNSSQDLDTEDLETSKSSQDAPFDTYFSYGKIDEDIRSAISQETDESPCTIGKEILAGLHEKSRSQREANQSESSSDSGSEEDDEEEVLVVDLETKRAVLVEAQSPKLKSALANEDFDTIFNTSLVENRRQSNSEKTSEIYTPDFESDSETETEEESDDAAEEGTEQSSFVWQAAYCRKLQPSLSMEIIEEECEDEEEDTGSCEAIFVPSTWRKEATPTRSALKSPEKNSQRKNVSWMKPGRHIYSYTVDQIDDSSGSSIPSPRRKWNASPSAEASYASFADWDFAIDDEHVEVKQQRVENDFLEDIPRVRPKPKDLSSGALFYRLSDIDNETDEEDEFYVDEKQDPLWTKGMKFSQFQPSQYFPPWDRTAEDGTSSSADTGEPKPITVNPDLPDADS